MYISKDIMNKVKEIEKEQAKFNRCIEACVCPKCGNHLNHHIEGDENLADKVFECSAIGTCDFTHTRAWR